MKTPIVVLVNTTYLYSIPVCSEERREVEDS